jgi:hypothetical protein
MNQDNAIANSITSRFPRASARVLALRGANVRVAREHLERDRALGGRVRERRSAVPLRDVVGALPRRHDDAHGYGVSADRGGGAGVPLLRVHLLRPLVRGAVSLVRYHRGKHLRVEVLRHAVCQHQPREPRGDVRPLRLRMNVKQITIRSTTHSNITVIIAKKTLAIQSTDADSPSLKSIPLQ